MKYWIWKIGRTTIMISRLGFGVYFWPSAYQLRMFCLVPRVTNWGINRNPYAWALGLGPVVFGMSDLRVWKGGRS